MSGQQQARVQLLRVCGVILFTGVKFPSSALQRLREAGWEWVSPGETLLAWTRTQCGKERRDEKLIGGRKDRRRGIGKRTQSLSLSTETLSRCLPN